MMFNLNHYNFSLYIIAFFFAATLTIGMRLSYRIMKFYQKYQEDTSKLKKILIIGAGSAGVLLLEEVINNPDFDDIVVGFVDDDKSLVGRTIRGIPVLGTTEDMRELVYKLKISTIIYLNMISV